MNYDGGVFERYELNDMVLEIVRDDTPMNPREEFDNLGTMVCWHGRYNLGDDHNFGHPDDFIEGLAEEFVEDMEDLDEMDRNEMWDLINKNAIVLPVYMYEHSGIALSTGSFNNPWDSGQVGWIYITHDDIENAYGELSEKTIKIAEKCLKSEVEIYSQYLNGDVYGFLLKKIAECDCCKSKEEEVIDSCWGFYGYNIKENGILDCLPEEFQEEIAG